ncbi:hypothetical protein JCM16303_001698 [Sporobolomyces ruberrimus]
MKFVLSTLLTLFVASTSVSAACQRRRSVIPSVARGGTLEKRAFAPDVGASANVVRRHKGGKRLDRRGPPAGPLGNRLAQPKAPGQNGTNGQKSISRGRSSSSMTSARASQQTGSSSKNGSGSNSVSSSSSRAGAQATKASSSSSAARSTSTGSSSSSSSSSGTFTGEATFYYQDGNAGACGSVASDSDKVVALQTSMYGSGSYCGKTITITNLDTGASTTATVADECPGCSSSTSIDLSTGTFDAIGSEDTGVLNVSWSFNVSLSSSTLVVSSD